MRDPARADRARYTLHWNPIDRADSSYGMASAESTTIWYEATDGSHDVQGVLYGPGSMVIAGLAVDAMVAYYAVTPSR